MRRGWICFLLGRIDEAIRDYSGIDIDGPLGPTVLARRSLMLTATGDTLRGLVEAARAIEQNPKNPWGWCARGWVYRTRAAENDLDRAAEDFGRAKSLCRDAFIEFSGRQAQGVPAVAAGVGQSSDVSFLPVQLRLPEPRTPIGGLVPRGDKGPRK